MADDGGGGGGGRGVVVVLMGGSAGRPSSPGDAIAAPPLELPTGLLDGAVNWDRILLVVGGDLEGVQLHEVGREGGRERENKVGAVTRRLLNSGALLSSSMEERERERGGAQREEDYEGYNGKCWALT